MDKYEAKGSPSRRVRSDESGDGFEMVRTPVGLSEAKGSPSRRVRSDKSGDGFEMVRTPVGLSEAKGERYGEENICTSGRKRGYASYCR